MWPAAIVALLVGGPLGACLFLAAGITHFVKVAKVDREYAKRGELPPTSRLIEKWLEGRKARGQAPKDAKVKKYGSWAYAMQRWHAMWEDLGEKHREVRDQYKKACEDAKLNGRQAPPKPTWKETVSGWKWHLDQLDPAHVPAGPSAVPPSEPQPIPAREPQRTKADPALVPPHPSGGTGHVPDYQPTWTCGGCHTPMYGTPRADLRCAKCRTGTRKPSPRPKPTPTPVPSTNQQGDPMTQSTQASGEVTGIPSAINYMRLVTATHNQHGGDEQLTAAMGRMEIGSGDIGLVQAAQEQSLNAAALWEMAAMTIEQHNAGVKQGYASAPDAADKHAQVRE